MKMGKKIFQVIAISALGLTLAACGGNSQEGPNPSDPSKDPIKIGVILDVSGAGSNLGIPERDSIMMLEADINENQGGLLGKPVKFIMYDNESNETNSVKLFRKLVDQDKVVALIGASQSGTTMSMLKLVNESQIPLVSPAASINIVKDPEKGGEVRPWVFKTAPNDSSVAERIVDHLKANNMKRVAFLSVNNSFGDSGLVEFEKVAQANGIEILVKEKFGADDKDMTPQLTKVQQQTVDATVVWSVSKAGAILTQNYRNLGIKAPLIHSHGVGDTKFIELAGPAAEGVIFPAEKLLVAEELPDTDPQKQAELNYIKLYEGSKGAGTRTKFGGNGYDAARIIVEAIKKANSDDPAKIREFLESTSYDGISGAFKMSKEDHAGTTKNDLVMIRIKDGKWTLVK